ncbi:prolyl oligopeptidase family serine peptidase [Mycobacterium sp. 155]|uniref:S9 family peptidase n=1 Tax=Mycobacterium sp. 155 TaxID=1157943 RepID=UPI00037D6ECA|nr:prolyl oligopeptidase family serine peptidase [Mycobacterium sp. 155]
MTPFHDLDDYLALPRVSGLAVSPDGSRLVTTVSTLNDKRTEFVTAVWELDVNGQQPARRLTHGAKGESAPTFTGAGDLLFLAARPTQASTEDDTAPAALWRLPAAGGEAVEMFSMPGGVSGMASARSAEVTVATAVLLASAGSVAEDKALRERRKDTAVSAVLHTGYPVRYWDHDLGPDQPHLLDTDGPTDLTTHPGEALRETTFDLSSDGDFLVTSWHVPGPGVANRSALVRIDRGGGTPTTIAEEPDAELEHPAIAPDGSAVAFTRETHSTPTEAPRITLCCMRFGEEPVELTTNWDRWPATVAWTADSAALIVTADEQGRRPIFTVDPNSGAVAKLTDDDYSYTDVCPAPGGVIYALRSSYAVPPHPVRLDPDGAVTELPCVEIPELPGTLTELVATADDGTPVRSWLTLPEGDEPAELVLWIHGGPLGSWNTWHWRWNPWLLTAHGYAVLMPDPGLSTGYGQQFVQRGWGAWGAEPYTDLMVAVDAACEHPRIDDSRTAAMGGSFGGYMANWIAGQTDRFDAIVTHASLWALDQFGPTTDSAFWWAREMTPEMTQRNSPHRYVGQIHTPMLVIHGDKDYRVPIGEALRLWYELLSASGLPADENGQSPHRFLYYPTENHWVLAPQHAKIWYQVVTAFLGQHLRGEDVQLPDLLG